MTPQKYKKRRPILQVCQNRNRVSVADLNSRKPEFSSP